MKDRFALDQGQFAFYSINDLDVDRYEIDGRMQQTMVGARELNPDGIPNKTWVSRHLIYTHGCGMVAASASRVTSDGRPIYEEVATTRPQMYVGTEQPGYAIVKTKQVEQACPDTASESYSGVAGVRLNSTVRRLAFALTLGEFNLLGSSLITDESRLIDVRDVRDRVAKVAPFLHLDADPYPVLQDGGLVWVIDAFTTTSRYPYAQQANTDNLSSSSGLNHSFNYVRNSVKAVVDAYDGTITLYVTDATDPIVQAWSSAFPGLFTPADQIPASLRAHFRYPEDLFRVQTNLYGSSTVMLRGASRRRLRESRNCRTLRVTPPPSWMRRPRPTRATWLTPTWPDSSRTTRCSTRPMRTKTPDRSHCCVRSCRSRRTTRARSCARSWWCRANRTRTGN
jgi:uncharacterized membrane protein (UPF0182 family)